MKEYENHQKFSRDMDSGMNFDPYTIYLDIKKWIVVILLIAASVSLLMYVNQGRKYVKMYESSSTFIVSSSGTNNNVYNNLTVTSEISTKFSEILNSSILQKKIAEELGMSSFPGQATAEIVPETNLLVLKVQAASPELSFRLTKAIMNNYDIVSDLLIGNVTLDVLQEPQVPSEPINKFMPFAIMRKTFLITLAGLCIIIAILSYMKDTIRKPKEVAKKLNTKLLETLYHEEKNKTIKAKIKQENTANSILITNPSTSFRYVETIRKLGRKVKSSMDEQNAKVLLVTSVEEQEGKSTVAANLAIAMAEESRKVLLIDGDLRKPAQYKIFGYKEEETNQFGKMLEGKARAEKLIDQIDNTNLYVMLNSISYDNSTEMITTGLFKRVLDYLKGQVDYIVIDTSPMAQVADTEELLEMADVSVLVVKQHVAQTKDINDAIETMSGATHSNLLGCIYNDAFVGVAEKTRNYGYGYGHGYGYGYGDYGRYGYDRMREKERSH